MAFGMSLAAFASVFVAWITYFATIPGGTVPARPVGAILLNVAGIVLSVAAIVSSLRAGVTPGLATLVLAALASMMGSFFLWLLTLRRTPLGDLRVAVGDTLPAFEATSFDGAPFTTDSLAGKRTLLKFFRGGW
jgi:hypothetical protein